MSLSVAEWKPSDEPVRVARAFSIKGVVRDREGRAVGGAHVTLVSAVSGDDGSAQTGGEGVFDFSRLAPGDYRLFATAGGETKRTSAVVTVTAGGADVALVLDPAVEVVVRIAGWPAREGETWVPLRFDGTSTALEWARVEAGGVLTFHHLHPDSTYAIFLRLDSDTSRIVCRRGISASAGEVRAVLESGRSIRGRLVAPRGTQEMNVSVSQDGIDVAADVDAEGRYEMKGLPDGTYRLHASGTVDGAPISGIADVTAGGTADIELKGK